MGVIKKFNPEKGVWEIFGSTDARDIQLTDFANRFTNKNVEGAMKELSDKILETTASIEAHSATLIEHSSDIAWLKISGGGGSGGGGEGGGGGSASYPLISSTFADNTIVDKDEEVKITLFFRSPNLGEGTAYVIVNGIEVATVTGIVQGSNTINIGKLENLTNKVSIYVKDRTGLLSNQLDWTIISGGIDVTVDFDDTADYYVTDTISMQFNVETASTDAITMHLTIDYGNFEIPCSKGFNEYIFPELGVGVHKVSFYIASGPYKTAVKYYNVVVVSSGSLYVSTDFQGGEFTLGEPVAIQYRISKASKEDFTVKMYLNGDLVKTLSCTPGTYYWTLNDLDVGAYEAMITVSGQYDAQQIITTAFTIRASDYTPLKITESGLVYRLNAKGRTNQDSDREYPRDDSGNNGSATLHNFNFYTNGWIDDELVCDGNAYVEIDYKPWQTNANGGSTIEIQYTSLDIGLTDARIFDYTDINTPFKGAYIDIEEATMKSLSNTGEVALAEDAETTVSFVIDRKNKFGKVYVDGICSRAFMLSDTGSGVNATREDFTHDQKIFLNSKKGATNFGACKIKDVRIYNRALSDDEIVQNYIAQETRISEQEKLYNFNYDNKTLPVIRMYGDMTNMTLETPVAMRIKYTSPDEDKYGQSFDLPYCQVNWQGTSSLQYVLKNFTARLKDESMATFEYNPYPNGILEDTFCFKADYMESSHSRNVGIAKFVNDCLYDTKNPMQLLNPNVRNAVNGFPCLMYINEELQGVYNFNLDRYSANSFGYTATDNCLVYEVSANSDTTAGAFYKWTEASGKSELDYYKSDFECLYPLSRATGTDNMSELIRLIEWVNDSSDEDFKENFDKYFNKEYVLRYYLFVLIFGAVDSLGKNMKLATWDGLVWYPQVYDADTTIGLDNTGFLKFDMDIEMGDANTFNTTGSRLWQRIVYLFQAELKEQYSLMRQGRFTVENIMKYLDGEQISKIPATFYNKDMQTKYLNYGSAYLYALHGSGEKHIKKWIRERLMYCDTLMGYMASSSDYITLRSSKLGEVYLDIETYIPMYVSVKWRDEANNTGLQTKRVGRGEKVRFTYNMPTATDQEIIVYAGYYLKRLGDVSNLQPTTMLIANASRLTEIECHSTNLINTDLSECTKLQKIDLSGCTALGTGIGAQPTLNIQNCKYLRYCNCMDTKLTAIYTMQAGGNLEEIYYPDTIQSIQVTNQTSLRIIGIPYGNTYCKNLASVEISNCHRVEHIHYPFEKGDTLKFDPLKHVQSLILNSSLDKVKTIQFSGFNNLASLELHSMHFIEELGFNNMMDTDIAPTLASVKISDCPLITTMSFNVDSGKKKIHFMDNAVMDLSGLQSVRRIEGNTPLRGIKTLIIPNSIRDILFVYEYGEYESDIKNIWSGLVSHNTDGYEGIDLLGIELQNFTVDAFRRIKNAINLHFSPTTVHPSINTTRDNLTFPYMYPEGSLDLSNYVGPMTEMFKGIDLSKFKVTIAGNRPQQDLTGLFEEAIIDHNGQFSGIEIANGIIGSYPFSNVFDRLFKKAVLSFDTTDVDMPTDRILSCKEMFRGSNITKDLDMTSNLIAVDDMFRDCKGLKQYVNNWDKKDYFAENMTTSGCYFNSGGDLEQIPSEWGGYGFYPEVTSEIEVNIPYENYSLTLCSATNTLDKGVVNWGDGKITFLAESNYKHVFEKSGTYTIKGHFALGNNISPNNTLSKVLTKVNRLAKSITNLSQAFRECKSLTYVNLGGLNIENLGNAFYGCSALNTVTTSGALFNNLMNLENAFYGCSKLQKLNLANLETENVTSMEGVFGDCSTLSELDISTWNTSNVTTMKNMFSNCAALLELDLTNFDTALVTNMSGMFKGCAILSNLVMTSFNTSNVTDFSYMFDNCTNLTEIDVKNFDTSAALTFENMFNGCAKLQQIDLSRFVTSSVKSMAKMFQRCSALLTLNISSWDTANVEDIDYMFTSCTNLTTLILGEKDFCKVPSMKYLFSGCSKLTEADFSNVAAELVDNLTAMFINCTNLQRLDLSGFNTSNVTSMKQMFSGCSSLIDLDISSFDTGKVTSMEGMFNFCLLLTSINVSGFNTSKVTSMKEMFKSCKRLEYLELTGFDTGRVTTMESMFNDCSALAILDLSSFKDSSLLSTKCMFKACPALTSIDLGDLTLKSVTDMSEMFSGCKLLEELDLSKFNTSAVTTMGKLFYDCSSITSLILGLNFKTGSVKDMSYMFSNAQSIRSVSFSTFDTSNVTNMDYMFEGVSFDVNFQNKNTTKVTSMNRMFKDFKGSSINMDGCDISKSKNNTNFISNTTTLENFVPPMNISSSIMIQANELPASAFAAVVQNLASVATPQILTIGAANIGKLTTAQLAEAINKNWSVV